jgi:hypothetical protein
MRKEKKFKEFDNPIVLTVQSKCPEKWILIDRETGETYQGSANGYWDRLDPVIKNKHNFTKQSE